MTAAKQTMCVVVGSVLLAGCGGGPDAIELPEVTPRAAAGAIVDASDTDGDDVLSAVEIEKFPAVRSAAKEIDRNADGKLSSEEINTHIEQKWQPGRLKLMPFAVRVQLDGKPLAGAEVEFLPTEALSGQLSSAHGTSDKHGMVAPTIAPESLAAGQFAPRGQMQPGFYRVRVTHPSRSIPARYQQSALGIEVAPSGTMDSPSLKLRSR